jgi:hypothetical protein
MYRNWNVFVCLIWVVLLNFNGADNLHLLGLQFNDLVTAVNTDFFIFYLTFKGEEASLLAHARKRFVARSFKQQLTLFVPNLK